MKTSEICQDKHKRRRKIREHSIKGNVYGMDYLDVSTDQRTLTVYFLGKGPTTLKKENIRIEGGQRIRDIQAINVKVYHESDPGRDDSMVVTLDRSGDFSTYTLRLVVPGMDNHGQPVDLPFEGFDPRYAQVDFSFKMNSPNDLDCLTGDTCPSPALVEPEINYLAKDYASFRQLILDRLALLMPEWKERHIPDSGITLVELLAYVGDYLSYYQDAVATEAYLMTARQRISVRRHVRLVDYPMHEGCNARAWLSISTSSDVSLRAQDIYFITGYNNALPVSSTRLTEDDLQQVPVDTYEVFQPLLEKPREAKGGKQSKDAPHSEQSNGDIQLYKDHNSIDFYTWGDTACCLPRGATAATLRDHWIQSQAQTQEHGAQEQMPQGQQASKQKKQSVPSTGASNQNSTPPQRERKLQHLKQGDVLIFEEVIGPRTGNPADADPAHRHVVRLTNVVHDVDALYDRPVVEIEWAAEDALPFPLCLSARGPAPTCRMIEHISVARGNVILVDHGKIIRDEDLGRVPTAVSVPQCENEGHPEESESVPGRFHPQLQEAPLTFSQPLSATIPASRALAQDPRQALPQLELTGSRQVFGSSVNMLWMPQRDLLESSGQDNHFVVEMDNAGFAHLRFGDGESGRQPQAEMHFTATYRVGNGLAGNVGVGAISHIVFRKGGEEVPTSIMLQPSNPFAAAGGVDPELLDEVKLFAPHYFRTNLERAITADDYAQLAARNPRVQRAVATLNWTGSWYEVLVAIDPLGTEEADPALLREIAQYLHRYRRIGHDLVVVPATYVSLDIAMTVCVLPHYLRGHVKAALLDLFSNRALAGGKLGFFHPDNLTFGEGIAVSKLVALAQAVPGVESVAVTRLERLFEGPNGELKQEFLPLGPLEIARLDNDPNFPEHGKLVLTMRGGR